MKKNIEKFRKGYMDMLLLKVLSTGDYYGYQIILIFRKLSEGIIDITTGSIYPVLYRLQDKGYISSYTKKEHPKMERVYYHLTPEGKEELDTLIEDYMLVTKATHAILNFSNEEYEIKEIEVS